MGPSRSLWPTSYALALARGAKAKELRKKSNHRAARDPTGQTVTLLNSSFYNALPRGNTSSGNTKRSCG